MAAIRLCLASPPRTQRGIALCLCVLGVLCGERLATAQLLIGAEYDHDRFTYHFDNPSIFDTTAPVPHYFEQRYDADNLWLVAAAKYTAGIPFETTGGLTPTRSSTGDDYDTFVDPDGTVIVAGTTGPISIRSWRLGQRADVARAGAVTVTSGYRLRVDLVDFGVGHKTIVRNGVVVSATDVSSPEHTASQVHEIYGGIRAGGFAAEFAPITLGRLLVQLPEKYPGQDLIYYAKGATGSASYSLAWSRLVFSVHAQHMWSYSSAAALHRTIVAFAAAYRL